MTKLFPFHVLATLAVAATACACSAVNPAGFVAASRLDPLSTSPTQIAVAVGVPQGLRLADGDAEFRIAFTGGTAASAVSLDETALLQLTPSGATGPRPNSTQETVYIARITPEDAPRIAAVQQEIRQLRAAGIKGEGSLTVSVIGGCYTGAAPTTLAVSSWLQTDPSDGFVPLTRRQNLFGPFGAREAAMLRSRLTPCADEG